MGPLFALLYDVVPRIFDRLSAYELAFLYFCGTKSLQEQLCKHVSVFDLHYDAHRRIAWPRSFLPLFPALKHVIIGGHDDESHPRVPDIDIRTLPSTLLSLELHIGNGLLSLADPSKLAIENEQFHLLPLETMFPLLQRLECKSLLCDPQANWMLITYESLPQTSLRSLKLTLTGFALEDFPKLPATLEELSIDASFWLTILSSPATQLPPQLKRLELFHVSTGLKVQQWPRGLAHLHLNFDSKIWGHRNDCITSVFGTTALPQSLRTFYLNAPVFWLGPAFFELLPSELQDLRLYSDLIQYPPALDQLTSACKALETKLASLEELLTLHLCVVQLCSLPYTLLIDIMPPKLQEFVVTSAPTARQAWDVEKMPRSLRTLCSYPEISDSVCYSRQARQSLNPSHYLPNVLKSFPNSLLELEDSILNYKTFPSTLTRLSLQSYSRTPIPSDFDFATACAQIPNVQSLSICMDDAFIILNHCKTLSLVSLFIDMNVGKLSTSDSPSGFDRDLSTDFDYHCFPRLATLHINPRFIHATSRSEWLTRLPPSIIELSLVPNRVKWTLDTPFPYFLESWIIFPALPRGLLRFHACISDIHYREVFGMLPDGLTELYLYGYAKTGNFGQAELMCASVNPFTYDTLDYSCLPLSLTKMILPRSTIDIQPFYDLSVARPQLSVAATWAHTWHSSPLAMPPVYAPAPDILKLASYGQCGAVSESLSASIRHQQAFHGQFSCADNATRPPPSKLAESEMKLVQKATFKVSNGDLTVDEAQRWLYAQRQEAQQKLERKESTCSVS